MPFFPALLAGGHMAVLGRVFEARTRALVFGNPLGAIACFIQCANGTRPSAAMRLFGWNTAVRASVSRQVPDGGATLASRDDTGAASGVYILPPTPGTGDENAVKKCKEK